MFMVQLEETRHSKIKETCWASGSKLVTKYSLPLWCITNSKWRMLPLCLGINSLPFTPALHLVRTKYLSDGSWKQNLFTLPEALQSDILVHFFQTSFSPYPNSTVLVLKIQQFKKTSWVTVPFPGSVTVLHKSTIFNPINNLQLNLRLDLTGMSTNQTAWTNLEASKLLA